MAFIFFELENNLKRLAKLTYLREIFKPLAFKKTLSVDGSLYKHKLKLQLSRTFLCILLIGDGMVSREIWIKQSTREFFKGLK